MAIVKVQSVANTSSTTSVTTTYTGTPAAGNTLIAFVAANASIANVSISGWATAIARNGGGNGFSISVFYKIAGSSEPAAVTANGTGASNMQMHIMEYSGLAATAPLDRSTSADSSTTNVTSQTSGTTAATTQASELWIAGFGFNVNMSAPAYTNGFASILTNLRLITAASIVSATGSAETTASWTTAGRAVGAIVTFGTIDNAVSAFNGWGIGI
jgi:hypothetical protein